MTSDEIRAIVNKFANYNAAAYLHTDMLKIADELDKYQLLRRAVNQNGEDCLPNCNSYMHEENCKYGHTADTLVSQQYKLEQLQKWKTGDWCNLCDAPQWVNHKGEHTCAQNPGLQELTEEMLTELEETRAKLKNNKAKVASIWLMTQNLVSMLEDVLEIRENK